MNPAPFNKINGDKIENVENHSTQQNKRGGVNSNSSEIKNVTKGMTVIVKSITRIVAGFIFLFGCYIILHGHLTPGGGFAGGVIITASFVLLVLAFGAAGVKEKSSLLFSSIFESFGGLMFLSVAMLGLINGAFFVTNVLPKGTPLKILSSGIILLANIAIGIKVGAGLLSIFLAFAAFHYVMKE
jgi:multicomponent Na+:H+ antiporter subunit B